MFAVYRRLLVAGVRAQMQYRWDFLATTLAHGVVTAADFLLVATILYRYQNVAGWNVYEVALLAGIASTAFALFRLFAAELVDFERYLISGDYDAVLVRPVPGLLSLLTRRFDLSQLGGILEGLLVMAIGLRGVMDQGAPPWLPYYAAFLPVAGAGIITALGLVGAALGFWLVRIAELQVFLLHAPTTAAQFPAEIYPAWLRRLLTGILPVAAMGWLPLRHALGKGGTPGDLALPFLVAVLALMVALWFWRMGEWRYQSTGS